MLWWSKHILAWDHHTQYLAPCICFLFLLCLSFSISPPFVFLVVWKFKNLDLYHWYQYFGHWHHLPAIYLAPGISSLILFLLFFLNFHFFKSTFLIWKFYKANAYQTSQTQSVRLRIHRVSRIHGEGKHSLWEFKFVLIWICSRLATRAACYRVRILIVIGEKWYYSTASSGKKTKERNWRKKKTRDFKAKIKLKIILKLSCPILEEFTIGHDSYLAQEKLQKVVKKFQSLPWTEWLLINRIFVLRS